MMSHLMQNKLTFCVDVDVVVVFVVFAVVVDVTPSFNISALSRHGAASTKCNGARKTTQKSADLSRLGSSPDPLPAAKTRSTKVTMTSEYFLFVGNQRLVVGLDVVFGR